MSVTITSLKCANCNAPLTVPNSSLRRVFCPFCGIENVIEGAEKNTEILSKLNVLGGLPFTASNAHIHRAILSALSSNPYVPLDIFEKVVVKDIRKVVVPSYWFDNCIGNGTCTFEIQIRTVSEDEDGKSKTSTSYDEKSVVVNCTKNFIVSGNKTYSEAINSLYCEQENSDIVDIESLQFPQDVTELSYDLPDAVAYNNYVKAEMEKALEKKAAEAAEGPDNSVSTLGKSMGINIEERVYPNGLIRERKYKMAGVSIEKGDVRRILVGIYEVLIDYLGTEYKIFISNDGEVSIYDSLPVNIERENEAKNKVEKYHSLKPKGDILAFLGLFAGGIGLIMFLPQILWGTPKYGKLVIGLILIALCIGVWIRFFISIAKVEKEKSKIEKELEDFNNQIVEVDKKFVEKKVALQGILSGVSGDPEAF